MATIVVKGECSKCGCGVLSCQARGKKGDYYYHENESDCGGPRPVGQCDLCYEKVYEHQARSRTGDGVYVHDDKHDCAWRCMRCKRFNHIGGFCNECGVLGG